jgi:hypothetical protein
MRATIIKNRAVTAAILLTLAATPAGALTELTISAISAHLPDADGFLEGDSDCYLEVRVDGTLIGVTSVIDGNNNPSWPAATFTTQYDPPSSPFLIMTFKAYDVDGLTHEYLGEGGIAYNWVAGNPGTYTTSLTSTFGPGFTITASFDANEVVVPVESETWGSIKALYR